jgi:hypothetical protein
MRYPIPSFYACESPLFARELDEIIQIGSSKDLMYVFRTIIIYNLFLILHHTKSCAYASGVL